MPCDTQPVRETAAQKAAREQRKREALAKAEQDIMSGRIKAIQQADGSVTFEGWPQAERVGWCDGCAYRALTAQGSSALRMALARTQATPDRMARKTIT